MEGTNKQNREGSEAKQPLHGPSAISILLDSYNDIFSDFDPSVYSERILSDDFIIQAKTFSKHKNGGQLSFQLLLPAGKRNEKEEEVIIKRLHSYFKSMLQQLESEVRKMNTKGLILACIGITLMIAASYISFMKPEKYYVHVLLVLFEPAGWFLLWSGLDRLMHSSKETKKDLAFYSKMTNSEIAFFSH